MLAGNIAGYKKMKHKIILNIVPVPCPRPRVTRGGSAYYPKRYRDFKRDCIALLRVNYPDLKINKMIVLIDYVFVLPRPKYMQRGYIDGLIPHQKRPDLDNLLKSINDCIESAGIISNDCIISDSASRKRYAEKSGKPRIEITITTK